MTSGRYQARVRGRQSHARRSLLGRGGGGTGGRISAVPRATRTGCSATLGSSRRSWTHSQKIFQLIPFLTSSKRRQTRIFTFSKCFSSEKCLKSLTEPKCILCDFEIVGV